MNEKQEDEHHGKISTKDVEIRNEMAVTILDTKDLWFQSIAENIAQGLKTKNTVEIENSRAVIVFFVNDIIIEEFRSSKHFEQFDGGKVDVLTEKNDNKERD